MNKKIKNICLLLTLGTAIGCTGNYEDINTNPYEVTEDQIAADDYVIQGTLKTMQGYVVPVQEHQFQFMDVLCGSTLGGYLAEYKGWSTKISTYNPDDEWAAHPFLNVIPGIYAAYQQLRNSTEDPVALAVAEVVKVAAFSQLTDIYGPIPYSKIGADNALEAPYDSLEEIYNTMFEELTTAIETLTARSESKLNANADMVFGGDLHRWVKFANTLKLRMAMRIVYAAPEKAQKMAEEAVNQSIGTLASNDDNPVFTHPSQNLYYLLCNQWGDYRVAADIVCYMNGFADPRRAVYFTESTYATPYVGWRRGTLSEDSNLGNGCSNMRVASNTQMIWMNAAEAAFLKAEGALRGWNMGDTAANFYEQGITLSFQQWNVSGITEYLANQALAPTEYIDQATGKYSATFSNKVQVVWDKAANFETQLEQIITQKWIANWRVTGVEGWAEFRRTGYPRLLLAGANLSGGSISDTGYAHRLPYPIKEKTGNAANYQYAVQSLLKGEDNMATHLWWDCNPNITNN